MGVSYCMEYSVLIRGSRTAFAQIPTIAGTVAANYKENLKNGGIFWDQSMFYEEMAESIAGDAQDALEAGTDPLCFRIENSDTDDTHGVLESFLTALDENILELTIAAYAVYVDTEYGEGSIGNILYSPVGSSNLKLDKFSGLEGRMDPLPDEDWIPYGWRHRDKKPPAAKAEGIITLLGDWGEAERATVEQALLDPDFLAAMKAAPMPGEEPSGIWQTEEGYRFLLGGKQDFGDLVQGLNTVLAPYFAAHKASYAALCRKMREKKLLLHLDLDEYSGPNLAWCYGDHSAWHFLISSDGADLLAQFTWCGTYSFDFGSSEGGAELLASYLYGALTGDALEELDEPVQHLMSQALEEYLEEHNPLGEPLENINEMNFDVEGFTGDFAEEHRDELKALIRQVEESVVVRPPVRRFVPETFDSRFKGKKFVVKGELEGYTVEEVQELVQKFGGKVGKNVTATVNYLVYGSGVGDSFRTALKHHVTFLSADYFEDMTR